MDLKIVLDGWPFDEGEEANNVRKIVGLDRRLKLQIRLREGVTQWEVEGRPDGRRPYGFESVLAYCRHLREQYLACMPETESAGFHLDQGLLDDLEAELLDYTRRREAFMLLGDYSHALGDAVHALGILECVREWAEDSNIVFRFDRSRPQLVADRARAEALLEIQGEHLERALQALSRGIEEIEEFFRYHDLSGQIARSRHRRVLVDFRRSLRERCNIALTDAELLQALKAEQQVAIEQEDYEMAARLRDKLVLVRRKMSEVR